MFEFSNEDRKRFLEIFHDGSPLNLRSSININLISRGVFEVEGARMRNHNGSA